jgi:uncharacterized protein (DUF885 family)
VKSFNRIIVLVMLLSILLAACNPAVVVETLQATSLPSPTPRSEATAQISARLGGLNFDAFLEASWRELILRSPETIMEIGLTGIYGKQTTLNDLSDAFLREQYQVYALILEKLQTYDRAALTPEQQVSFDIYAWYLQDKLDEQPFMYYDYPVTFFTTTSVPDQILYFFTDLLPLASAQDASTYLLLLEQVDTKMEQVLEGLKLRQQAGIVPPRFASEWALYGSLNDLATSEASRTPFYNTLQSKLAQVSGLTAEEKQAFLDEAKTVIQEQIQPAYRQVKDYMEQLSKAGSAVDGVLQFPQGQEYYAYLLRHYTTTGLTAEEIHTLGLQELERIQAEMRALAARLGYPEGESIPDLYDRVAIDSATVRGDKVLQTYTDLIAGAEVRLEEAFDFQPKAKVVVIADVYGGFYVAGSYDGSRPGAFYAAVNNSGEPAYAMPTLAYHEAIPGHHFQISLAAEMDLPSFRRIVSFNAYTEGWALYAERLAWELGWYADNPQGDMGRLQAEAFRAARLVVDTGMHAKGWTFDQAQAFFTENTGFESGDSIDPQGQIARYVVWPGQSTSYYIGFLRILELRQRAMDALGDQFDLKEFHRVVLGNGSMPLEVLERVIDDWIQTKLQETGSLTPDQFRSLSSLAKVGDYPIYTMHAYNTPPATAGGIANRDSSNSWGCSLFAALGAPGNSLYGRNFDWDYSPILVLYNHPAQGFASVSMVDLSYLVEDSQVQDLLDLPLDQRLALLSAPSMPFDGMNEHGLVIGMAAVPEQPMPLDPAKPTLDSLQVMRAVLDQARTVDEAVAILASFNIDWGSGPPLHYLIADRSGKAVLVEFYQGEMRLIPNISPWHLATNFLHSQVSGALEGSCPRYDTLSQGLSTAGGRLDPAGALQLLASVSQGSTQWSVVYEMDGGMVHLVPGRDFTAEVQLSFP